MKFSAFLMSFALLLTSAFATGAAAQDNYRVRAGDTLRVEVIEDSSLNRTVLVTPDGNISIPLAGVVRAAGNSVSQIEAALSSQLASNFAAPPSVFVSVEQIFVPPERQRVEPLPPPPPPVIDVYVLGEVASPGRLEVSPDTNLLQLFAQMGGFTRFAATRRIQLRRVDLSGVERVYVIDYDAILAGTTHLGLTQLAEGDVIVAPERGLFE